MYTLTMLIASFLLPILSPLLPQPGRDILSPIKSYYQIQQGDTLWALAQQYGYSVSELMAANPDLNPRSIPIGQVIVLPSDPIDAGPSTAGLPHTYTIQVGDTLSSVAYRYKVTVDELQAVNPNTDSHQLQIGEQILLPNGEPSKPEPTLPTPVPSEVLTYTVQAGDTLSSIAAKKHIPLAKLIELNAPINPRQIVVGQVLKLSTPPPVVIATEVPVSDSVNNAIKPLSDPLQSEAPSIAPLQENIAPIVPVDASIHNLNIPEEVTVSVIGTKEAPKEPLANTPQEPSLTGNVMPITINLEDAVKVKNAELAVNGTVLATFKDAAPYTYELDTSRLVKGTYNLSLTITTTNGVVSTGSIDFEVKIPSATVTATAVPLQTANNRVIAITQDILALFPQQTVLISEPRILEINGQPIPFNFVFSATKGLVPVQPVTISAPSNTLNEILSRPFNVIPAPIREAITSQHPKLWSVVTILLTIVLLPQGLFTLYWMLYTWNNARIAEKYRAPQEFVTPQYSFTAILPARHEEDVIKDTIRALDRIEYPDDLKEILVMIRDEDDDVTIQRAQEAIAEIGKENIKLITFTEGPKNKPNGLNRGLKAATKDVICVFDAEDEPHPELYNVINTVMLRDNADVVQAGVQLMNFKSTWFSALNCLEYFFWFKSGLHCFTRKLNVTPLGGNTVFFKRFWLERINGWDEKSLTEDADVGIRLSLKGAKMQIVYDEKHATREETPHNVDSFIKQRTRWCQGFYEIFAKGDWRQLPTMKQKITALYILLNSLMQAALIIYLPIGLYIGLTQKLPIMISMISYVPLFLMLLQLFINLVGIREFTEAYNLKLPLGFRIKMAIYYYPYQLLLSASAFRAMQRFLTRKNAWEKTAHSNLHRQQQSQTA